MNIRITIEIDGREITATTLQPSISSGDRPTVNASYMAYVGATAPPALLAHAEALGATDAGPAYGGPGGFGADMPADTGAGMPASGDFMSMTVLGATDAGPAPADRGESKMPPLSPRPGQ
jgi:hypothetical protein